MNISNDARFEAQLAALPPLELPKGLWSRVSAAQRRRVRQRRTMVVGSCMLAALAIVLPNLLPQASSPEPAPAAVVVAPPAHTPAHARLQSIDHMIQAAYNRGASDAEITALLSARRSLLDNPAAAPALPVNI